MRLPVFFGPLAALAVATAVAGCGGVDAPSDGMSAAESSCARELVNDRGRRRTILVPPRPVVHAVAVTERTTRVEWRFGEMPPACRPASVLVSVDASKSSSATPTTEYHVVRELSGTVEIRYPEFLPPPDEARVSGVTRNGRRSDTVFVRIERSGDVPPDPPDPIPPVTAPAGEPVPCSATATSVSDERGDVLTHNVGSPPAPVEEMTNELRGIDIVQADVAIEGRTLCGRFELAAEPRGDFGLKLVLRDASTLRCCASLGFRRVGRRLELGYATVDLAGRYVLRPVPRAGARVDGTVLTISGTLPPPSAWQPRSRALPRRENVAWSATTSYTPQKYGPYFGDWLPRYAPYLEPVVRQSDGEVVVPGR